MLDNTPVPIRESWVINTVDMFVLVCFVLQCPFKGSVNCFKWHLRKEADMNKSRCCVIYELNQPINVWFINAITYVSVDVVKGIDVATKVLNMRSP